MQSPAEGTLIALPPFPRTSHIIATRAATRDDRVVDAATRRELLRSHVHVEEKLDGANVCLAFQGEDILVGTRGGEHTMDRGEVRPRLRAWAWHNHAALRAMLGRGEVLYAEWLADRHAVPYDDLPGPLIVIDIRLPDGRFLSAAHRDSRLVLADLVPPPAVFDGELGYLERLDTLAGPSAFGGGPAEGLIIRQEHDGVLLRRAKWVRPDCIAPTDRALSDPI